MLMSKELGNSPKQECEAALGKNENIPLTQAVDQLACTGFQLR